MDLRSQFSICILYLVGKYIWDLKLQHDEERKSVPPTTPPSWGAPTRCFSQPWFRLLLHHPLHLLIRNPPPLPSPQPPPRRQATLACSLLACFVHHCLSALAASFVRFHPIFCAAKKKKKNITN